jgi:hypothetical protein
MHELLMHPMRTLDRKTTVSDHATLRATPHTSSTYTLLSTLPVANQATSEGF